MTWAKRRLWAIKELVIALVTLTRLLIRGAFVWRIVTPQGLADTPLKYAAYAAEWRYWRAHLALNDPKVDEAFLNLEDLINESVVGGPTRTDLLAKLKSAEKCLIERRFTISAPKE